MQFGSIIVLIAWVRSFGGAGWSQEGSNKVSKKYNNTKPVVVVELQQSG